MALHPEFPTSPYDPLIPEQRWFPADTGPWDAQNLIRASLKQGAAP